MTDSSQLLDVEQAVIGTLIYEAESKAERVTELQADLFSDPKCRAVFRAICLNHAVGKPIDEASLLAELDGDHVEWRMFMDELLSKAASYAFANHKDILAKARDQRRRIAIARDIARITEEGGDASGLIEAMQHIGSTQQKNEISIIQADKWLATEHERIDPVFNGVLDKSTKSLVVGPSKARKSFFTLQMAMSMATGRDAFSWRLDRRMTVLLIQAEVHIAHYRRRVENMVEAMGVDPADLGRLHILNGRGEDLAGIFDKITDKAIEIGADVVIIDPLYCLMSGDETDQKAVREVLRLFDEIIEKTGCALLVIHHTTKGIAGDRQAIDRAAGSGLFARHCDSLITLSAHATEEDAVVIETITRGHPPRDAFCLQWEEGCFQMAEHLPAIVKTSFNRNQKAVAAKVTDADILKLFVDGPVPRGRLEEKMQSVLGMSRQPAREALKRVVEDGTVRTWKQKSIPPVHWHGTAGQIEKLMNQFSHSGDMENTGDFKP